MSDWWDATAAPPPSPSEPYATAEWEPGRWFAVAHDRQHAERINQQFRMDGRDVSVWTVAELAVLIRSIPIVTDIKGMFPGSEILPPRLPPVGPVPRDDDLGPILDPDQEAPP